MLSFGAEPPAARCDCTLLESEIPAHAHTLNGQGSNSNLNDPAGAVLARPFGGGNLYKTPGGAAIASMSGVSLASAGGDQPHNNLQPYLTFYFAIALQGIFPPRG
jgi:microcystin-dependent protein